MSGRYDFNLNPMLALSNLYGDAQNASTVFYFRNIFYVIAWILFWWAVIDEFPITGTIVLVSIIAGLGVPVLRLQLKERKEDKARPKVNPKEYIEAEEYFKDQKVCENMERIFCDIDYNEQIYDIKKKSLKGCYTEIRSTDNIPRRYQRKEDIIIRDIEYYEDQMRSALVRRDILKKEILKFEKRLSKNGYRYLSPELNEYLDKIKL